VTLWFLNRDKGSGGPRSWRDRRGEVLFIDARKLGNLVDRTHRELSREDIDRITLAYHAWRGEPGAGAYADLPGFCASANGDQIAEHRFVLTPGRYVGSEEALDDGEPTQDKIKRLTQDLYEAFDAGNQLESVIRTNLENVRYVD
jgi:type I restriction enzyme M protein